MSIFKAYDIRGIHPDQFDADLARRIGAHLVDLLEAKVLVVGRDMRASAPEIQGALMDGIRSRGCDVLDIGLTSTPMNYFAIGHTGADGGVAVTASHNPPQYIGAKISKRGAVPMSKVTGIGELEQRVATGLPAAVATPGRHEELDVREPYREHLQRFQRPWSRKVVIDTANGMGGLEVPLVLEGSELDWTGLYLELDGTFPNHEANPLEDANIVDLQRAVKEQGADVGFAFDGDGDRCCVVDERGQRVGSDLVTALLAREFLAAEPGAAILFDLRSSRVVPEEIEKRGGVPVRERVGHSFIKATLRERNAPFAGELSGHFYFRDHYYSDCATMAMVRLLNLLEESEGRSLSSLVEPLLVYRSTGEVNFEVADPDAKIAELEQRYGDGEIDHLDGVSINYPDFWFNVRKSNTEPLLRLRLEAKNDDALARAQKELYGILGTPHEA